jgi:hypothetical protein
VSPSWDCSGAFDSEGAEKGTDVFTGDSADEVFGEELPEQPAKAITYMKEINISTIFFIFFCPLPSGLKCFS